MIGIAFLCYYFPFVSKNEQAYDQRNLRALNQVAAQVANRVELCFPSSRRLVGQRKSV